MLGYTTYAWIFLTHIPIYHRNEMRMRGFLHFMLISYLFDFVRKSLFEKSCLEFHFTSDQTYFFDVTIQGKIVTHAQNTKFQKLFAVLLTYLEKNVCKENCSDGWNLGGYAKFSSMFLLFCACSKSLFWKLITRLFDIAEKCLFEENYLELQTIFVHIEKSYLNNVLILCACLKSQNSNVHSFAIKNVRKLLSEKEISKIRTSIVICQLPIPRASQNHNLRMLGIHNFECL